MEIEGIIKAVKQHEGRYGVCINETWFNSFGTCPVQKGDNVLLAYEVKGDFKNITQIGKREVSPLDSIPVEKPLVKSQDRGPDWPEKRKSVKGSAYEKDPVGLAVEVFNGFGFQGEDRKGAIELMNTSIALVILAQKAFS